MKVRFERHTKSYWISAVIACAPAPVKKPMMAVNTAMMIRTILTHTGVLPNSSIFLLMIVRFCWFAFCFRMQKYGEDNWSAVIVPHSFCEIKKRTPTKSKSSRLQKYAKLFWSFTDFEVL